MDTSLRAAPAGWRVESVARVASVDRSAQARTVDPARRAEPRDAGWPRPDPARIPIADIVQFERLVFGPEGRAHGLASSLPAQDLPPREPAAAVAFAASVGETRADRISMTLAHLTRVRGL